MLTWMQKHKKYLVITIWISTIAFVGAGFVGWGAYDMNTNRANSVAKVGSYSISVAKFQQEYSNLYNYYNSLSNGAFTGEQAEKMNLEGLVLQKTIQDALLVNYANDLGIRTGNDEVLKILLNDENFKVDGKFDKTKYESILQRMAMLPRDYENSLKNQISISKLLDALHLEPIDLDVEMLSSALFMRDKLSIHIVKIPNNQIKIDDDKLLEFWQKNKNSYMTDTSYTLDTIFVPIKNIDANDDVLKEFYDEHKMDYKDVFDKLRTFEQAKNSVKKDYAKSIARTAALSEYLKYKKGELNATNSMTISQMDPDFPIEQIKNAKIGDVIKPFEYDGGFLIVKISSVNASSPMDFTQAKPRVIDSYKRERIKELLSKKSEQILANFSGTDIGFVSRVSTDNIKDLSDDEFKKFISELFRTNSKYGYVIIGNKSVVYKILEQNLLNDEAKSYENTLRAQVASLKNSQLQKSLIEMLSKRYPVEIYR